MTRRKWDKLRRAHPELFRWNPSSWEGISKLYPLKVRYLAKCSKAEVLALFVANVLIQETPAPPANPPGSYHRRKVAQSREGRYQLRRLQKRFYLRDYSGSWQLLDSPNCPVNSPPQSSPLPPGSPPSSPMPPQATSAPS